MNMCIACKEQYQKGRYDNSPHTGLLPIGEAKIFRGMRTGGYEEQEYTCRLCEAHWIHSNDKNDIAWRSFIPKKKG